MNYKVRLDTNELNNLGDFLINYAKSFDDKVHIFLARLAQVGIEVASVNGGDFGSYITYRTKWEGDDIVVTASSPNLVSEWYSGSKTKDARIEIISPLLMAEFGSGHYAITADGEASGLGGQGTLNVYGHAHDADGWYWWSDSAAYKSEDDFVEKSANGRWKFHSKGVHPAQPLHKAVIACIEQVNEIAREVFG